MDAEEDMKNLENSIQYNIEILSKKIINYNEKLNEFNLDGKKDIATNRNFKLRYNLIFFEFLLLYIPIYFILRKTQPDFICDKIKNEKTYFIENNLSILKLIVFSFIITVCLIILFNIIYYMYRS